MDILAESKFQERQNACQLRSSVAMRWARKMLWFTFILTLFAIWQHRELAPPVHDGIYAVWNVSADIMTGAHDTRQVVQGFFSGGSGTSVKPEFNAITQWLLDNR